MRDIRPEQLTAIIDTREQTPVDLAPLRIATGLPVLMADNHDQAGKYIGRILFIAARRRWRESQALVEAVEVEGAAA